MWVLGFEPCSSAKTTTEPSLQTKQEDLKVQDIVWRCFIITAFLELGHLKMTKYWDLANHVSMKLLMEATDTFQNHLHSVSDLLQGNMEHYQPLNCPRE